MCSKEGRWMLSFSRRLAALLLLTVLITPLGTRPQANAAQPQPPTVDQSTPPTELPVYSESEPGNPNDGPASADPIGRASERSWLQRVQGRIGSAGDVDYYQFTLSQPASSVKLSLEGLSADYDLVLAGGPDLESSFDPGQEGLEGVTEIGAQISAIGAQISAIGAQISAIGAQISAIGAQISAIGAQISAISAKSGTSDESIDTFLWLPGTYYAVVAPSNGAFSDAAYSLTVQVNGSGLGRAPEAPEVELRAFVSNPSEITTLYIVNSARMAQRYADIPTTSSDIESIQRNLNLLAVEPPYPNFSQLEYGLVLDIADLVPQAPNTLTVGQIYERWDANQGNPLYANYVAGLVDNLVEAARDDATPGSSVSPEECPPEASCIAPPGFLLGSPTSEPTALPNLRNVVLVGGDDVIPGFRLPDLTTIANEADYLAYLQSVDPTGVIAASSPQGAALRYRMITSDNPYGAGRPYKFYGFPFYLPDLAVGRLVESPFDIARYVENALSSSYVIDLNPQVRLQQQRPAPLAAVTGYDFLKDQATEVVDSLTESGLEPAEINQLINDTWTSDDLEQTWFNGNLDAEFSETVPNTPTNTIDLPLSSINAHFDHWQVLPAVGSAGNFPARRLYSPGYAPTPGPSGGYFINSLGYSVGCHSGFNVLRSSLALAIGSPNYSLYAADFAQAINSHGGNWIGNTGYGYGTADGIDYSERLSTLFTEELGRNVTFEGSEPYYIGQSIGEALRNAKQRYVRNASSLSPYDYKALQIMTLYGLPYVRSNVRNPIEPPLEDERFGGSTPLETQAPYTPDNIGRLTRLITFELDLDDPDDLKFVPRTGSSVLDFDASDVLTITDEFVERGGGSFPRPGLRVFDNNQVGAPSLPAFAYDISASSSISPTELLQVKDVVFLGGVYGELENFNPQITQVLTETDTPVVSTTLEPDFAAGAGIWYPDKFFSYSSVGEGEQQRDQLLAAAAQFRADSSGETGLLRPYEKMVFQVIYDDPGQTSEEAVAARQDNQPPLIRSVQIEFRHPVGQSALAQANRARVVVTAFDQGPDVDGVGANQGVDIADVSAVFIRDGVVWELATFQQPDPSRPVYTTTLPVSTGSVRVIVRVTDRAGNSSYYTAKGTFTPPLDKNLLRLPMLRR
jgi:hypothetical protein